MAKPLHSEHYRLFLQELRSERLRTGKSQVLLAQALDKPQTYISKCETGARRLDVVELRLWIDALGSSFPDFAVRLDEVLQAHADRVTAHRRVAR